MLRRGLPIIVLGGTFLGCLAPDEPDTRTTSAPPSAVGESSDAIRGGYVDPGDPAAVGIVTFADGGVGVCSGSLIAPNLVLTARHCVSATYNDSGGVICGQTNFSAPFSPTDFYVTTRGVFEQNEDAYHTVQNVVTLPVDDKLCGQDLALLILDDVLSEYEAVPYVPRVDTALIAGEQYYAIGFGITNDGLQDSGIRRRRDSLFVECAEEECRNRPGMTTAEWVGDQGICSGDSGGPALDLLNRVVGVTSRGVQGCDDPVYGSTRSWGQWIKDNALLAAQIGGYEPLPWMNGWPTDPAYSHPVGQACTEPTACPSGLCYAETCTRLCNEASPCPTGFVCEVLDDGVTSLCAPEPPPDEDDGGNEDEDEDASAASDGSSDGAAAEDDGGGCSFSGKDPVTPVPWVVGLAVVGLAVARRRRR